MAFRRLHEVIRVTADIFRFHVDGAFGTACIHAAAPPHGLAFQPGQNPLVHIEGPAVIAGEPAHVGRIGHKDQIDIGLGHRGACPGKTRGVFVA